MTNEVVELSGWKIIKEMLKHVWPKDKPSLKVRVVLAVGLLFGAKVIPLLMMGYSYDRQNYNHLLL